MNSIRKFHQNVTNPLKFHIMEQNSPFSIKILPISQFFTCSGVFLLFSSEKPEIKDKGGLLTGTSWLKKQKFQQKPKS